MNKIKIIIALSIAVLYCGRSFGQAASRGFSEILQTYYLYQDKDVVDKTISYLNNPEADYKRMEPVLTGFFAALFAKDSLVKNEFGTKIEKLDRQEFKDLFTALELSNVDSVYAKTPLSPAYNDMNWSSFFATGEVKYLDRIINNIHLSDDRIDRTLFLTGASAKWSLCSNARQDQLVKEHLASSKVEKKNIKEILKKEPAEFKEEMKEIVKQQREKGLWK
ncbi:MAG TPA: hypothetical protein VGC65_11165 [Bacteroidia bacterium]|jgi:hypothetical protein